MTTTSIPYKMEPEPFHGILGEEHYGWDSHHPRCLTSVRERLSTAFISTLARKLNRRLVAISAIVFLSTLGVLILVHPYIHFHRSMSMPDTDGGNPRSFWGPPPPEFCTTWPVDEEGEYNTTARQSGSPKLQLDTLAPSGGWKKPAGVKVVVMIFFGRRRSVDILDCYLKQNLHSNGGYVDEVWFMIHTKVGKDLDWLRGVVADEPSYKFQDFRDNCTKYGCLWDHAVEDDTIYLKVDDDMAYIHHDAIPQLVHTRIAQPHPFAISAQIVNSPVMCLESYHYGAIQPLLPDPRRGNWRKASETWRISELPEYPATNNSTEGSIDVDSPYMGHPWLMQTSASGMSASAAMIRTPVAQWNMKQGPDDIAWGPGLRSWGVAAQQQYSLLWNLEHNQMDRYHFGRAINYNNQQQHNSNQTKEPGGEQLYDMQYRRYNLNFLAIWGRDIKLALPISDDELELTQKMPERLGRPFVVDTRAIVAHHSFGPQRDGIRSTDLLDRWRAFANENVCAADNQKRPWDPRCAGF